MTTTPLPRNPNSVTSNPTSPQPLTQPDALGRYGKFGGKYVPETLMPALSELEQAFYYHYQQPEFQAEFQGLLRDYVGRPSPLYFADRLTTHYARPDGTGAQIYLKREDLNHTGAHKINNALGQVLLAKRMGKRRVIAETGAGQHGVATATVCARFGLECIIYMGVHDMEQAMMGTSLGVDMQRGTAVIGGHRHHLKVINHVRRYGSIAEAVKQGMVHQGIFYECVKAGIPFSLAGSIRDDGPLPDTQMDLIKAQEHYSELIRGADMILMLSSMLHSIGVGNMTPAGVKMVCVDINPAVVTKLSDRGSIESVGVVTDVGLFLSLLTKQLDKLTSPYNNLVVK